MGVNRTFIFRNENVSLESYLPLDSLKPGEAIKLTLFPRAVIDREVDMETKILEKEMSTYTKKVIVSLRKLEILCSQENLALKSAEKEREFNSCLNETKIDIERLSKLAESRQLNSLGILLQANLNNLVKYSNSLYSSPNEANRSNYELCMRTLGTNIKTFILEYRSTLNSDEAINSRYSQAMSPANGHNNVNVEQNDFSSPGRLRQKSVRASDHPEHLQRRFKDARIVKNNQVIPLKNNLRFLLLNLSQKIKQIKYDSAEVSGFLNKQGNGVKIWRRRWCVLKDGFISYFRTAGVKTYSPHLFVKFIYSSN